jgi:hypothetical protein
VQISHSGALFTDVHQVMITAHIGGDARLARAGR